MKKLFLSLFLVLFTLFFVPSVFAANNNFVSVVNPVRGNDFWDLKEQKPETAVSGQVEILNNTGLNATWLLRFDALSDKGITDQIKNRTGDEKGLFLEITPSLAGVAKVTYHKSESWHSAGSAFLTGYEPSEREKLIDAAFDKFKNIFGYYPSSVGAWWIDSYSLGYMKKKFGVSGALIVADQYSTDNYQIWGQYFGTPYYPDKFNALSPAQNLANKLDIVVMQWAARDPVNSYGNGVMESTFSVQANDYLDYHNLDINYFSKLLDIYTRQDFNQFGHIVVGLENSYSWERYKNEYEKQLTELKAKQDSNQFRVVTMKSFSDWYKNIFPKLSPEQIIVASDPLGSSKKTVWFMNPYFRAAWFLDARGSVFRDIRQYIDGQEELCFQKRCDSVNFATSATRVLDEVSFGNSWKIDDGRIDNFIIEKTNNGYEISYRNAAGNLRKIQLLPRDIGVDGKILSIDSAIMSAVKKENATAENLSLTDTSLKFSITSVFLNIFKFAVFFLIALFIPGFLLTKKLHENKPLPLRIFLSVACGLVMLTSLFYIISLFKVRELIYLYLFINSVLFLKFRFLNVLFSLRRSFNLPVLFTIIIGTVFGIIPTFQSGLSFSYGMGFWGPNTHDGIWHMALINQLVKAVPPENPVFGGVLLKNYHFFYDLTVAATMFLTKIPVSDLLFRFYPFIFSLLLGIGSYYLLMRIFKSKIATFFSLYLIYFAGSFGWIVEFIRERHFGGESAFWVNQAVSYNLNPPYAISLIITIALILILFAKRGNRIVSILLLGTLISFKSYTGILLLLALGVFSVISIIKNRNFSYFWITFFSCLLSALLFIANFENNTSLITFAPFWFINSMIDSPDRVGWVRLSLARNTSFALGQWPKFIAVSVLSLLIFVFGNLGLRLFALGTLSGFKQILKSNLFLYMLIITILSMIIPVLFIQAGNPWNTIQFFYPSLYTTSLLSGVVIASFLLKLNKIPAFIFAVLILIVAPINSFVTAGGYLVKTPHAYISSKEIDALSFLSKQENGVVLTYPYDEKSKQKFSEPRPLFAYDSTGYVSAISRKSVFLEDEPQNQILLTDNKKRRVASYDFFLKPLSENLKFLKDNQIKFIYLPKIYNVRLDESSRLIRNIFENEEVIIYKVN